METSADEIAARLAKLIGVEDGPWKFGLPEGTRPSRMCGRYCLVCGCPWGVHFGWKCSPHTPRGPSECGCVCLEGVCKSRSRDVPLCKKVSK